MAFAEAQALHPELAGEYNVGPDEESCVTTGELAMALCEDWGDGARWASVPQPNAPREAGFLALDASKLKSVLGWRPRWNIEEVVAKTAEGYKELCAGVPAADVMGKQIEEYFGGVGRS